MLIGLHGNSRVGKDSIACILQDKYDYEWRQFAKNLRLVLEAINPRLTQSPDGYADRSYRHAIEELGLDETKKRWPQSVDMMIGLGQAVRDLVHEDAWTWGPLMDVPENLVISDVRQPNEAEKILALGGQLWRVERPTGSEKRGMDGLLDHFAFDVTIYNTGTLEDLVDVVDAIMEGK